MNIPLESYGLRPEALEVIRLGYESMVRRNPDRGYHNPSHVSHVILSNLQLGMDASVPYGMLNDLGMAAAWHDDEQELGSGPNEEASAESARQCMREVGGFTGKHIDEVGRYIISTITRYENGDLVQNIDPNHKGTLLMTDGDLSNLGGPTELYRESTWGLFTEVHPGIPFVSQEMYQFLGANCLILANHRFSTAEARRRFNNQEANRAFTLAERKKIGVALGLEEAA